MRGAPLPSVRSRAASASGFDTQVRDRAGPALAAGSSPAAHWPASDERSPAAFFSTCAVPVAAQEIA